MTKVSNAGSIVFDGTIDNREYKAHTGDLRPVYRYSTRTYSLYADTRATVRVSPLRGVCLSTCFGTRTIFAIGNRTMARHTATRAWPTCRSYVPMRNTQQLAAIRVSILATQSPSSSSSSSSSFLPPTSRTRVFEKIGFSRISKEMGTRGVVSFEVLLRHVVENNLERSVLKSLF